MILAPRGSDCALVIARRLAILAVVIGLVCTGIRGPDPDSRGTVGRHTDVLGAELAEESHASPGPEDQSEFLIGSVAAGLVLVESRGGALNWTLAEEMQTIEGVRDALRWLCSQEPRANLSFYLDVRTQVLVDVEPTQLPISVASGWISEALAGLGYTQYPSDPILRAREFNQDLRDKFATDWAFSIFVADSGNNPGTFSDGVYAQSLFGGPWIVMSRFSSVAYNSADYYRVVPAHEIGHVFYATDEYDSNPPEISGYLGVSDRNGEAGIMNRNTLAVGPATAGQLGWRDSDSDGVLDILDVVPTIRMTSMSWEADRYLEITGYAEVVPLQSKNPRGPRHDLTLARIAWIQVRLDGGEWIPVAPQDGGFGAPNEGFQIRLPSNSSSRVIVELRAGTSSGTIASTSTLMERMPLPDSSPSPLIGVAASVMVVLFISVLSLRWIRRRANP